MLPIRASQAQITERPWSKNKNVLLHNHADPLCHNQNYSCVLSEEMQGLIRRETGKII